MGCDIHILAQKRVDGQWETIAGLFPFEWRSYGMFGFFAGVRNLSAIPPIAEQRGLPDDTRWDTDEDDLGDHSHSWLSVDELTSFDYDQPVEDRRIRVPMGLGSNAGTAEPGGGEMTTYREFLGTVFFDDLEKLKAAGAERIVFGFDS